ncbi:MAG: E3 binding domain-containing protein, partial [Sediminibacterium sp.]|nr:E3 binding domain-containing protein [Sediminibacterium sp.]
MADKILMPRLSDTMTEGVIASWHKQIGDKITKGDLLAEIETDKATMELESYQNGYLLHIGAPNGGKLQVNDLLCIIGNLNDDIQPLLNNPISNSSANTPTVVENTENKQTETSNLTSNTIFEEAVLMPRLSDTMTEGVIASWHKQVGDSVNKGDLLADIETDKATMELESYKSGYLLYQGASAGAKIQVNDLLCIIGSKDFNIEPILKNKSNLTNNNNTSNKAEKTNVSTPLSTPISPENKETNNNTGRIFASPLVKKIASDLNISLQSIQGSGENGRIVKQDLNRYIESKEKQPTSTQPPISSTSTTNSGVQQSKEIFTDKPVSQMRKTIAQRLSQSKFTAPHFYLTMKINMDEAIKVRTVLNDQPNSKISFNDIVVKA